MTAKKNSRVNTSLHLPFKAEALRLTREYNDSVSEEEWSIEGWNKYRKEHGSPEFLEYLRRTKDMELN